MDGPWKRNRLCATTSRRSAFHKNDSHTENNNNKKTDIAEIWIVFGWAWFVLSGHGYAHWYAYWSVFVPKWNIQNNYFETPNAPILDTKYLKQSVSTRPDYVNSQHSHTLTHKAKQAEKFDRNFVQWWQIKTVILFLFASSIWNADLIKLYFPLFC